MSKRQFSGKEKVAILLIALGPQKSAEIFKHLNEEEIEELTLQIANMRMVSPEEKQMVIEEFYQICLAQEYISEGGINYAKDVLERALGSDKALDIINKLTSSLHVRPFEFVRKADPNQLLNYIQNEHPQTIALILSYLGPTQAGQILSSLSEDKQADVMRRIAIMDRTSPEVVREIEAILESKFSNILAQDYTTTGGIQAVVDILNSVDRGTEKHIMEDLDVRDVELSEEIRRRMFVFEDIITLDNRSIQRIIREIDNSQWAIALKSASEEVKNLIFTNMSKRLVEMIKEDIEFMGPVRIRDIEDAQQNIVNIIRKLEEDGEIITPRGGDEIIV
ncbi:flagellar motor switch protein FliG [Tissierella praeacuta]|uniref:Flagellar motor switch protein FliG n=1 Tax=Tissierella praeacuta DSM 18095 TaxID=1123404 RepID=A0A1M4SM05_9FIRM|nr:flagellar motor switch protein FliG [Tissierella praeacuta]HAE92716.1 flagellar motor switch protein FliG [Tissierella sp.]MBU5254751.1 flagellar motor switch protein FliG [Tissierella praeacuta]TCU70593.1 flagellar motor switch protein FliG [Tissierella praeacuta]SHE33241.1 flagellar motor switch protein FliG [Tissierella praeacuta DSM 18095]SUP01560.1 Flagellar motor switch protein FliG [Tissierella praeacuta]